MNVMNNDKSPQFQLRNEILDLCRGYLEKGVEKLSLIKDNCDFEEFSKTLNAVKAAFPDEFFNMTNPLNARVVSQFEFDDFRIENVLFESLPGWEVNGSVYLPKEKGVYPAVICPVGHSSKTGMNYVQSAQTIAKSGYVVITFDPPGCAGEIKHLNEHFENGVIGYLTSFWSQTHFVADAMRAADYLLSRDDVDKDAGISYTGVSGGGLTSIFCGMLDKRAKFIAPVCCISEHKDIHLRDLYTSCPESFGKGYIFNGIDFVHYLALFAPNPCLIICGKTDEVFDYQTTARVFSETKSVYNKLGSAENINLFIDENSGHAYTVKMANEVVKYLDKYIKGNPALTHKESNVTPVNAQQLLCHPSTAVNMFTISRDKANELERTRVIPANIKMLKNTAAQLLGIEAHEGLCTGLTHEKNAPNIWFHTFSKMVFEAVNIKIPALCLKRSSFKTKRPAFIFFDEDGKWNGLHHQSFLCKAGGFLQSKPNALEPIIISADLSGFGELANEPCAFDLASWNDINRILTYLGIAANKPIMGRRVRDALCVINGVLSMSDVDIENITIGGRGLGAVCALFAALISGQGQKLVLYNMLCSYKALTQAFPFLWSQTCIIPDILKFFDLPDIIKVLSDKKILLINPLDEQKKILFTDNAKALYAENAVVACLPDENNAENLMVKFIQS